MTGIRTKPTAGRKFVRVLNFVFSILLLMRWTESAVQANQTKSDNFPRVLGASGRSAEIPESADVYGWLVGSWELEVLHYAGIDVSSQNIKDEAHFNWVLEGRAIQDVWIMPRFFRSQA
jgi:hypothetical protein